jgi:hypothetical protein
MKRSLALLASCTVPLVITALHGAFAHDSGDERTRVVFQSSGEVMHAVSVAYESLQQSSNPKFRDESLYVVTVTDAPGAANYEVALTPKPDALLRKMGKLPPLPPPGTPMLSEVPSWHYTIRKSDFTIQGVTGVL